MNKYAEMYCRQHPTMKRNCPSCHKEFEVNSKEFFSKDVYETTCQYCNQRIGFKAKELADSMEKELKKIGVRVK